MRCFDTLALVEGTPRVQRDPRVCRRYADAALALLEARIAEEAEP